MFPPPQFELSSFSLSHSFATMLSVYKVYKISARLRVYKYLATLLIAAMTPPVVDLTMDSSSSDDDDCARTAYRAQWSVRANPDLDAAGAPAQDVPEHGQRHGWSFVLFREVLSKWGVALRAGESPHEEEPRQVEPHLEQEVEPHLAQEVEPDH